MAQTVVSQSVTETQELAKELVRGLSGGVVVALTGELGAGKTSFAQGIGQELGIDRMLSPTYTLIREYPIEKGWPFDRLYHVDLYRLASGEVLALGLPEIWFDPKNLVLIEWAEKIDDYLPKPYIRVGLKKLAGTRREVVIEQ